MSNIFLLQLLRDDDLLFFSVLHHYGINFFDFLALVGQNKIFKDVPLGSGELLGTRLLLYEIL